MADRDLQAIIDGLKSSVEMVRETSASSLRTFPDQVDRVVPALFGALTDSSVRVRKSAIGSLGDLLERSWNEAEGARGALSGVDPELRGKVVEALLAAVDPRDAMLRRRALQALVPICGSDGEAMRALVGVARAGRGARGVEVALDALRQLRPLSEKRLGGGVEGAYCGGCLHRWVRHQISAPGVPPTQWFACRKCLSMVELMRAGGGAVAVLDREFADRRTGGVPVDRLVSGDVLYVDWLRRRDPFDYDRIEIVSANEADLRDFLRLASTDEDEERRMRHRGARVLLDPELRIEPDTFARLEQSFGPVTRGD